MGPNARAPGASGSSDWELFLLRLRYRAGRLVRVAGNDPVLLDDPETVWIVYSGQVEVFTVPLEQGRVAGARRHLFRAPSGTALFGMDLGGKQVGLLASGAADTQLLRVRRSNLAQLGTAPEFAPLVAILMDRWIAALSAALATSLAPREFELLETGRPLSLAQGRTARTRSEVLWVSHDEGRSRLLGRPELTAGDGIAVVPLSAQGWLQADEAARLEAVDTTAALAREQFWSDLDRFHQLALDGLSSDLTAREQAERNRLDEKRESELASLDSAYTNLAAILNRPTSTAWIGADGLDPLLTACQLVGQPLGVTVKAPRSGDEVTGREDPLLAIARVSRLRTRRVALRGDWWTGSAGPLLAYVEADGRPVALLPTSPRSYALHDPLTRTRSPLTATSAASLQPFAYTFYRRFEDRAVAGGDLVDFGMRGSGKDVWTILIAGTCAGLLGLLTPIITKVIFDQVIPGAQRPLLFQVALGLFIAAFATAMFQIAREFAVLRLAGNLDSAIQGGVMDRLLDLPATFFRQYSAGDLGMRALGITTIRETLSRVALSTLFTSLFSLFSFVLLFFYDLRLAWVACGIALLLILVEAGCFNLQVASQRGLELKAGRLSGTVLQLINGVPKLRVAGAEGRAFAYWASKFGEVRRIAFHAGLIICGISTFNGVYPILASMTIFGVVSLGLDPKPTTGTFLAFNSAFGQFLSGVLSLSSVLTSLVQTIPLYERARPILEALPEVDEGKAEPGELSGAIEINHLSFRYQSSGPPVLDDISLQIRPGEFVALVGQSGSGKSTLLRQLLGFERPESGAIFYDGRDLATLDVREVRRQIGTVLQSGRLSPGDIFTNIIGASTLTLDDAWEAARQAGLEEDIRQMPMGMQTLVSEGGSTLSGGQRQRLLIARALVHRPRIIFFDEATSALDNRTQEIVSRSLQSLAATRIVIAHRLSTIINADRIYVLRNGQMIESGTYRELMQRRGLFAELARRQIA